MTGNSRPALSLSIDLDNLWSYQKAHGDPEWRSLGSYLDQVADLVLARLADHGLTATFFVIGQDATLEKNHNALRAIARAGHEIGNHAFHHEPLMHLWPRDRVAREIKDAELAIEAATGCRPHGFRGPGFSLSADTLSVLAERGYLYDASTFPTFIGPLARSLYVRFGGLSKVGDADQARLFGTFTDGRRPIRPYFWRTDCAKLLEMPVTTMPVLRLPMHHSYILHLAGVSCRVAVAYLKTASTLCRLSGIGPSYLLHPLDFLGGERVDKLAFFPGMNLPTAFKLELFDEVMEHLKGHFRIISVEQHAREAAQALSRSDQAACMAASAAPEMSEKHWW